VRDQLGKIVTLYGTHTDIEDRKGRKNKLRRSEAELRRMIDAIPQTIVVLDPDGKRRQRESIDARLYRSHDRGREGTVFSRSSSSIPMTSRGCGVSGRSRSRAGFRSPLSGAVRRKDGQYRWFLIQYKPASGWK